ncbi:MAG TPA: DUF1365 domain-containing protein [Solirubrobacteraceae bacterium]|nr:DUF1365 domain-containing protein [Solirubrobacteraceae bacterium]
MSASAIYEGTICHRRAAVRRCQFRHRLALIYLDLDELGGLLGGYLIKPRPGLVRFRRSDYLGDPALDLAEAVRERVRREQGSAPSGPVRLLTQLRWLGHCFNPVSFYYCFTPQGRLDAMVAEVTNTPWGERHSYVLARGGGGAGLEGELDKALHVSPFMGMRQRYRVRASAPGQTLGVEISSSEDGREVFAAALALQRRPLERRTLAATALRYPGGSWRVLALIYGHALALGLRGVPVHPHPQVQP